MIEQIIDGIGLGIAGAFAFLFVISVVYIVFKVALALFDGLLDVKR